MAYDRSKANKKTVTETLENGGTIVLTIAASKISTALGIELTVEQLMIITACIKILISRIRNKYKHYFADQLEKKNEV